MFTTDGRLKALNAEIDVEGKQPVDVANAWLLNAGFLQILSWIVDYGVRISQ